MMADVGSDQAESPDGWESLAGEGKRLRDRFGALGNGPGWFSPAGGRKLLLSLDAAVASFAAASLAFLIYAMPASLFSRLVVASGLPGLVPAAEPPLGMTARFAVLVAAAALCFLGIWSLLRLLDRIPARRPQRHYVTFPTEAPRLRRGDAHPDAPPRPPLLAGHDFGEPFETWPADPADPAVAEQIAEPLILSDPLPQEAIVEAAAAAPEHDFERVSAPAPARGAAVIDALKVALPDPAEESVTGLMQRLEGGLVRREQAPVAEPAPPAEAPAGHRLRSAINDLERMAKGR
ncbi:hypothetical protein [Sphingosinicella rhizophila]|uniref:Uncharacterized protein n=1 Tax=Sphingosinicella rhizophila TaxID=3050082 RepID=A0ABU3Q8A1_9SPHN|nr:hypothetical protein [Sphingosinicella sp. GR2756]MDT9599155.1 hypothetical protein [Sphingosinicella sp. GR2756]